MTPRRLQLTPASDVTPEPTTFLWAPYIPTGEVALIAGQPGLGKSTFCAWLAAQVTLGRAAGDLEGQPRPVIMATAEDSIARTAVPRLMAAHADLRLVHFVSVTLDDGVEGLLSLSEDLSEVQRAVEKSKAALLVLDPLVSFLDGIDSHKDQQVRRVLSPLAGLAHETGVAVLGLMHFNKNDQRALLDRVSGSTGFSAAARTVLFFGRRSSDPEGVVHVVHGKTNLARKGPSIQGHIDAASIDAPGGSGILRTSHWVMDGESPADEYDLLAPPPREMAGARAEAAAFLQRLLANGAEVPAQEVYQRGLGDGHSKKTLDRASKQIGVAKKQVRTEKGTPRCWMWSLSDPEDAS